MCVPRQSHSCSAVLQCIVDSGEQMRPSNPARTRRNQRRVSAVLPVRVRGTDKDGRSFDEIAHTLDISATSSRIGAIRRQLKVADHVTVVYRQRRTTFSVIWTRLMGKHEYQVGLQAVGQEKEMWGLPPSDYEVDLPRSFSQPRLPASCETV